MGELELTRRGPPSLLLDWLAHLLQYRHAALTFLRFASLEAEDAFASDMTRDDRWGVRARRKGTLSCLEGGQRAGSLTFRPPRKLELNIIPPSLTAVTSKPSSSSPALNMSTDPSSSASSSSPPMIPPLKRSTMVRPPRSLASVSPR